MPSTAFERTASTVNLQARKRAQGVAWHAAFERALQAGKTGGEALRAADAASAGIVGGDMAVAGQIDASSNTPEEGSALPKVGSEL